MSSGGFHCVWGLGLEKRKCLSEIGCFVWHMRACILRIFICISGFALGECVVSGFVGLVFMDVHEFP